jgi:NADH-quinone oxidoreductase subunit J
MTVVFYLAAIIAVAATVMVITRLNAVHALLYLIVSLLAVALVFFLLGAPFAAAMEVIIYAGAIMVLFVFVVMMLNLGPRTIDQERHWLRQGIWIGPSVLAGFLLAELIYILIHVQRMTAVAEVGPKQLALTLFGPYLLGVELASMLLLAGLVGAYHLGQRPQNRLQRKGN